MAKDTDSEEDQPQQQINFAVDPNKTPVMYIDSYLIGSNDNVVTFNFAQALPDPAQQNVVARVALTRGQAKEFLEKLNDHIEKFEV